VGEVQAGDGGDLQAADLGAAVTAVAGAVGERDRTPRQAGQLAAEAGLVGLDDQQVGGVLFGDQSVGMLALSVHGVGGDDLAGQVQVLQERLEPSDLVGLGVHLGLVQDRTAAVVNRREQVHLRGSVVAAAAQGLVVDRDRPSRRAARR
jgi:hypothetical protein